MESASRSPENDAGVGKDRDLRSILSSSNREEPHRTQSRTTQSREGSELRINSEARSTNEPQYVVPNDTNNSKSPQGGLTFRVSVDKSNREDPIYDAQSATTCAQEESPGRSSQKSPLDRDTSAGMHTRKGFTNKREQSPKALRLEAGVDGARKDRRAYKDDQRTAETAAKTRLETLEDDLTELRRKNRLLESAQAIADRDARTAKQSMDRLRERLTDTSKKYADLKIDYKDLRSDYKHLRDSNKRLKDDHKQLRDTYTASETMTELGPCLYCLRPLPQGFVSHVEMDLEYQLKAALPTQRLPVENETTQKNVHTSGAPVNLETAGTTLTAEDMQHIAMQNAGMVWDDDSGMYYNYTTGYYYHTQSGLYFDPTGQAYYYLNPTTNEYEFHSSAADWVDGNYSNGDTTSTTATQQVAEEAILCIRFIIQESPNVPVGTVFVIGLDGGTIGRDNGQGHVVHLKESSVSRDHAEIRTWADEDERAAQLAQQWRSADVSEDCVATPFWLRDLGSSEGTYINDRKISVPEKPAENSGSHRQGLYHKDTVKIGNTTLLVHAHPGSQSCAACAQPFETPSLKLTDTTGNNSGWTSIAAAPVQIKNTGASGPSKAIAHTAGPTTARDHQMEVHKRKFGLDKESRATNPQNKAADKSYVDRAKKRRSDKPGGHWTDTWDRNAPVQAASEATPIETTNKGFKLLNKMGWSGGGLGKSGNKGIAEPVAIHKRAPGRGLGSQR